MAFFSFFNINSDAMEIQTVPLSKSDLTKTHCIFQCPSGVHVLLEFQLDNVPFAIEDKVAHKDGVATLLSVLLGQERC